MPFQDVPPSYAYSTSLSPLTLVAPYLESSALCACSLVSRHWHTLFIPHLWGDPASHFGIANDAVYVALTRFKKTLRKARLGVRELTHTLHLPPALSEIYGGPHPTWLRDVLIWLPNLQSLVVSGLPFFDHHSLLALRPAVIRRGSEEQHEYEQQYYGSLKLLLASNEPNTTSIGLSIALPRFPGLVYLDLSFTKSARDAGVLAALGGLPDLQALKLQSIGLRDSEAEVLANAIGIRVRLLDVRDNHLTDMAVRSLMQACFYPVGRTDEGNGVGGLNSRRVEDWPVGMAPGPDFFSLDTLRSEELDHELLKQLTSPLTGRLAFEDIPHRGLTHLYIAGNSLSVEGLSSLLKSQRLHFLDGGSVDTVKVISRSKSLVTASGYVDEVKFPGAEKLVPVLVQAASRNLTYLRADHAVATGLFEPSATIEKKLSLKKARTTSSASNEPVSPIAEVAGDRTHASELPAQNTFAVELPAGNGPIYEMDASPPTPRAELQGDMIFFAVSPPVGQKPETAQSPSEPEKHLPIRGDGAFAPEVDVDATYGGKPPPVMVNGSATPVNGSSVAPHTHDVSDESSTNSTGRSILSPVSPMGEHGAPYQPMNAALDAPVQSRSDTTPTPTRQESTSIPPLPPRSPSPTPYSVRQARIRYLLSLRPQPDLTAAKPTSLHPSHLPNLRSLVLTSVPITVPASSSIISRLKAFISACAVESNLSHLLASTDYSLPPGRARHQAEKAAAKRLFALSAIVLEMASPSAADKSAQNNRSWHPGRQRASISKSSTGDHDSENLWSAAADDFSFFAEDGGEEEDECGIYTHEREKYYPSAPVFDDKILLTPEDAESAHGRDSPLSPTMGGTLSPVHALGRNTSVWQSPRNLPMGRNRRLSNEASGRSSARSSFEGGQRPNLVPELPGHIIPSPALPARRIAPTSNPTIPRSNTNNTTTTSPPPQSPAPTQPEEQQLDLVTQLSAFRRERKAAYDTEMAKFRRFKAGIKPEDAEALIPPFVEGYWSGEIRVVRNSAPKGRTGTVDIYGNWFEKGYLYP